MDQSLRSKVNHRFNPTESELKSLFDKLKSSSANLSKLKNPEFVKREVGMNHNFTIKDNGKNVYQLKILVRKGYPSLEKIDKTYKLLKNFNYSNDLVEVSEDIFPYGYYIYEYIEGVDGSNLNNSKWIKDYCNLIKKLQEIKVDYFGNLNQSFKANNLREYYQNIYKLVDNSFGDTFNYDFSIWDLCNLNLVEKDFLENTLEKINKIANALPTRSAHLCHGDMSPHNIIYCKDKTYLIDWDEARSHFWPSELARYLFFTKEDKEEIKNIFIECMEGNQLKSEIELIIRLEHIYQYLRKIVIYSINSDYMIAKDNIEKAKSSIEKLLESSNFS